MAGSDAQAGFYYQNIVAAGYALDLIELGTRLRSLTLENPARAPHIDDVIADFADGTTFVQVKWSREDTSAFTLHNLTAVEDDSISLLAKLARGYSQIATEDGQKEILLLSTRGAGTNRQPQKGFAKSLADFIAEFHEPFVLDAAVTTVQQATGFDEYKPILEHLLKTSGLQDFDEFSRFLKCLRFRLNEPDRDTLIKRVRARLAQLGIEQRQYATLLDEVVRWSIDSETVRADDVLRVLGLRDRFVDRLSHSFPVDEKVWVETPELFKALDASLGTLKNGFVLLEGEPGAGKSTALAMYLSKHPDVRFGYYCFVPDDRSIGNERLGDDAFVRSICIGLRNAFPGFDFPTPYASYTLELLNNWLKVLSAAGRRVVFVVDGLDHVNRKNNQSLVARPLTSVLDGELPCNVVIVLSSRYPEALPSDLRVHVQSDPRRHIRMPRFGSSQVREFFRLRGVDLSEGLLESVTDTSGGVPIYLEYLAERLGGMTHYEQGRYIESTPTLRNKRIDHYHQHLWEECSHAEPLRYILAILAARGEFTTPETLRELLQSVGVSSTLGAVHEALARLRHVLRVSEAKSVAIRHSSLAEFVSEQTKELRGEITQGILSWYDQHPDTDEAWRHRLRHLFEAGQHADVLAACDDAWLLRAWANHRPIEEIQQNLDIAWQAASATRDSVAFVRIALMKQRIALVGDNLALSPGRLARLLLDMGRPDAALRLVWDGERRRCTTAGFAEFCLAHAASAGRALPEHILDAGLGNERNPEFSFEDTKTWYRARSHAADPIALLLGIGELRWEEEPIHGHVRSRVPDGENQGMNRGLQHAVIRELAERRNLRALALVRDSDALSEDLRSAARAASGLVLARAGENTDATEELRGLDLSGLPNAYRRWIILEIASCGLYDVLAPDTTARPRLPRELLDLREQGLSESVFHLYDDLRLFFLRDETGFPWVQAATTGMAEPAKTIVSVIARLANLWTSWIRDAWAGQSPLALLNVLMKDLDLEHHLFRSSKHNTAHLTETLYRRDAYLLYEQVWSCATLTLSGADFAELALGWTRAEMGVKARRHPEATQSLAVALHARVKDSDAAVRELLELAERSARGDEETSEITSRLVACASAWARCGCDADFQRLWRELLDVACGVHWRKDYQFNEIFALLPLAHEQDPSGTLDRVEEQLALAHQLDGTSQPKTVAVAIAGLIELVARLYPAVALEALAREEALIFRDSALHDVVLALLENNGVDRRLVLALALTMARWDDSEFKDDTRPAMFAVYSSALHRLDVDTARKAYDVWRQVLLVEKDMSGELGRWAAAWVHAGEVPSDVLKDHAEHPPSTEETTSGPSNSTPSAASEQPKEELDALARGDLSKLEARLDEILQGEIKRFRRQELEHAHRDWRSVLGRAAGRDGQAAGQDPPAPLQSSGLRMPRPLLGQAADREWSEAETNTITECFKTFADAVIDVPSDAGSTARDAVREALGRFVVAVSNALSWTVVPERFEELIDLDTWLERFIRPSMAFQSLDQTIREGLPRWIEAAPLSKLAAWDDFRRRRCSREGRAIGLLALAKRRTATDPQQATANLIEAWKSVSESFFYLHKKLARGICSTLLDLDYDKGCELLFESFQRQYQRFPSTIIYALDNLLAFADKLPGFDAVRLYGIWATHNRSLVAGLSEKPADLSWLKGTVRHEFQDAVVRYLMGLLAYPVVDIRLLALDELFRLLREREELLDVILNTWPGLGDGQKEYVATLLFSLSMDNPASAQRWASRLIALAQAESHYNLRAIVAEAVQAVADRGATLDSGIVADARALKAPPQILLAHPPPIYQGVVKTLRLPHYLQWSMDILSGCAARGELEARMREMLSRLYPQPERGFADEMTVHRAYNINDNFDVIEIGGEYDCAVRAALNHAVHALVQSHAMDPEALARAEDVLRLRDPTDNLVQREHRPDEVSWIKDGLSDEEFTRFADMDELQAGFGLRNDGWVTLFEHTEQRRDSRCGQESPRVSTAWVTVFGVPRSSPPLTLVEVANKARRPVLSRLRNRYRFELGRQNAPSPPTQIIPIVVVTERAFRGRVTPALAAINPELADELALSRDSHDLLGYVAGGEKVVRSIEWQEAFDQGRRRHEPVSVGFLLQIERQLLTRIAASKNMDLWAHVSTRRTTDRYKPEAEMDWENYDAFFPLRI